MTPSRSPLVSVVTPVYNGERYLRQCIESVLMQTYGSWDYTIVNNCSTDGTLAIAREYAEKDPRIRIHDNTSFLRVIENHNNAFRQISPASKYCKVVAADDWIAPECLEKMVALAEEHPSVVIVGSYRLQGTKVTLDGLPYPSTVMPGREVCRGQLRHGPYVFGAPTSVLYRADVVRCRESFYNESNLHADTEACLEFLEDADFGFVHQVLSFTRERVDSLTSFSRRINTYYSGNLYGLWRHGSKYLTEAELGERRRECLRDYYRYLGREVYRMRGKEFWDFHRTKLATVGSPLNRLRLGLSAAGFALDLALNPKRTIEGTIRRLRGQQSW